MKILLTGGDGFFGSRFLARFGERHRILATDVGTLDITRPEQVEAAFEQFRPELVLHAAAVAETAWCERQPGLAQRINVDGALNVGRACRASGARLVFISSEQVFNGNEEGGPYAETAAPRPDTVYGRNKLEAEGALRELLGDDALWVLRFTWLFGLPERHGAAGVNVLWNAIGSALRGEKRTERSDERRGLTYVHDLLDRFEDIVGLPGGLYHVGSRNDLSRFDIARLILRQLGLESREDVLLDPVCGSQPRDVRLDVGKLAAAGVAFPSSEEALTRCLAEFRFRV
jgi:dTDP-4-dehydrorhamnose reductase